LEIMSRPKTKSREQTQQIAREIFTKSPFNIFVTRRRQSG
jgi:hypothetical protein